MTSTSAVPRVRQRPLLVAISIGVIAAAAAQAAMLAAGFLSVAADDAAHVLRAQTADPLTAWLRPDVWPPLDKVAFASVLRVWADPIWSPRLVTFIFGLLLTAAMVWLGWELCHNAAVAIGTGLLAAIVPYRLVFAVSTMGEVFFYLPIVVCAALLARWLRDGRRLALFGAALALAVATTARYEAWFFAVALGVLVLVSWRKGDLKLGDVATVAAILMAFPVAWLAVNALSGGPIDYLSITRQQTAFAEPSLRTRVVNSAGYRFVRELVWGLVLILGVVEVIRWIWRSGWQRSWALTLYAPMLLVTLATIATKSVPFAAPWRLGGVWLLLTLPVAVGIVVEWWSRPGLAFRAIAVGLVLVSVLGWLTRDARMAETTRMTWDEVALASSLPVENEPVLVEIVPGDYQFLDLIAASGRPDRFELTRGIDPYLVALFVGRLEGWEAARPELVSEFVAERYDLTDPADAAGLRCAGYAAIAVRTAEARAALLREAFVVIDDRAGWAVFVADCP